jgi:hypothetical protein
MGNSQALKLGHLVSRWSGVASGAECLPRKAWKTILVQPIGTDRTISVELGKHGENHLYKMSHMSGLKESNMSNGEVLAVVN